MKITDISTINSPGICLVQTVHADLKRVVCCSDLGKEFFKDVDSNFEVFFVTTIEIFEKKPNGDFEYLGDKPTTAAGYRQQSKIYLNGSQNSLSNETYHTYMDGSGADNKDSWWQFLAIVIRHETLHFYFPTHARFPAGVDPTYVDEEANVQYQTEIWAIAMKFPETQPGYRDEETNTPDFSKILSTVNSEGSVYTGPKIMGFPSGLTKLTEFACP